MPEAPEARPSIALIGECMIELREMFDGALSRGYGGDVLNTSVYLSRLLGADGEVRFTTVLGDDPFSSEMVAGWQAEGIVCDTVGRKAGANAGLYFVRTDAAGERTFHYWRTQAPAREIMVSEWAELRARAMASDWIYLSGITLAVIGEAGRAAMLDDLTAARERGAKVVFDGNYRPVLWEGPDQARRWYEAVGPVCAMALAGVEDEARVFGDASPEATADRLRGYGIPEVVVKRGEAPVLVDSDDARFAVAAKAVDDVLDTTAAGDSFNAAYLAGRIRGHDPKAAAEAGVILAAAVIRHPGAIIPTDAMPMLTVSAA